MISDWNENINHEKNDCSFKLSPRIRTWSTTSADTFSAPHFDQLKENAQRALYKPQAQSFPDVYDGANQWYTTVEHLSRKVSSQRQEIWSLQKKLRAEVENSHDLQKSIQLDRREHKEVVSALNLKIQLLEKQLRRALLKNTGNDDELLIPKNSDALNASTNPKNISTPDEKLDTPDFAEKIRHLEMEMVKMSEENRVLREIILAKRTDTTAAPVPAVPVSAQPSQVDIPSAPQPEQPPETFAAPTPPQNASETDTMSPRRISSPSMASSNPRKESESVEVELRRMLIVNSELTGRLKAQSEEMAQQKSHFQFLQTLMERNLERAASLDNNNHHLSSSTREHPSPSMNMFTKPSPPSPPHEAPELSLDTSLSQSDSETSHSSSLLSQRTSTPIIHDHQNMNHQRDRSSRSAPGFARSVKSPTTSTPSAKASPNVAKLSPLFPRKPADPNTQRLEDLLRRLRNNELSEDDVRHYEEIYNSVPQIIAERPQLAIETGQLANHLERNVSRKHIELLRHLQDELQEVV